MPSAFHSGCTTDSAGPPATCLARLRPSTWANYRTYTAAYVVPVLGQVKLQALTPVQLNHLYAHLLARARRKTISSSQSGLAPKTVRNVHLMLHSALHDAMRWGYLVRNLAEAADPPAARPRAEGLVAPGARRIPRPRS
jgi:Phage integrase, N-terminal SAM-like domain